eukprot:TRINITY_DN84013_c0_g1_i1.p2 TRINITY_DN84013_c0_g1~~TRINITY_DN84013_c0_g1_i1.p2  ORF type:complete len:129 (-),score=35.62 TRINITY_DN84013_c0_g1_i1:167-553(-)
MATGKRRGKEGKRSLGKVGRKIRKKTTTRADKRDLKTQAVLGKVDPKKVKNVKAAGADEDKTPPPLLRKLQSKTVSVKTGREREPIAVEEKPGTWPAAVNYSSFTAASVATGAKSAKKKERTTQRLRA